MAASASVASAAVGIASAAAFFYVGILQARRPLPRAHRPAGGAFALAWIAAGAYATLSAIVPLLTSDGRVVSGSGLPIAWTSLFLSTLMVGSLVAYLAYLLTGQRSAVALVATLYLVQSIVLIAWLQSLQPTGAAVTGWTLQMTFAHATDANRWLALLFLVPTIIASAAYLSMLPKARAANARYRIALVGGGLTLWSVVALYARLQASTDALPLARLAAGLVAVAVLAAYLPPAWARRRWGVTSIRAELPTRSVSNAQRAALRDARMRRAEELV